MRSTADVVSVRNEIYDQKADMARQLGELDRKLGEIAVRLASRNEPPPAPVTPTSPEQPVSRPKPAAGIWDRLVSA